MILDVLRSANAFYRKCLTGDAAAVSYLKKRGVSGEVAARYELGFAPGAFQGLAAVFDDYSASLLAQAGLVATNGAGRRYDRFRERIMFPIRDLCGDVVAFGGRVIQDREALVPALVELRNPREVDRSGVRLLFGHPG